MLWVFITAAGFAICTIVLRSRYERAPLIESCHCEACIEQRESVDTIDEINQCISRGRYHVDCANAYAAELIEKRGCEWSTCEGDELRAVIFHKAEYAEAIEQINRIQGRPCND